MNLSLQRGVVALAFVLFVVLIAATLTAWSPVPLVDGWPVYHRIMGYLQGTVDLKTYLLGPHGAHPHSIVYALYLLDLPLGARQILPHLASVASTAAAALLIAFLVRLAILERAPAWLASLGAAAALVIVPTLSTEVLAPFQVVLTASRLVYCAVIAAFVVILRRRLHAVDFAMLALSCVLVTFHGSGLLFGVVVLLQHLALGRSWMPRIAGAAPLVASIIYTRLWLPPGAGEMASVAQWLEVFGPGDVLDLAVATFAYYAVPLVPAVSGFEYSTVLIAIGGAVAVSTSLWAAVVLVRFPRHGSATVALALIALFVALSAASAALVWESRSVLGVPGVPALNVLGSQRYTAVALLAYAILAVPLLSLPVRFAQGGLTAMATVSLALLVSSYNTAGQRAGLTDGLDQAATSLYAGADITDPPAERLWPGVIQDWFWPPELAKLVDFMNERHIGYAYGLPSIGTSAAAWWQTPIENALVEPAQPAGICSIAGTIPPIDQDILSQPSFLAVTDTGGTVVGAVTLPRSSDPSRVTGHVRCPDGPAAVTATRVVAPRASIN